MTTHYLDLDFTNASFYEYSKTEKEGFEQHTTKSGKESFRKYYPKGIYGKFQSISVRDSNFGKRLTVRTLLNGEAYVMNFPLYDDRGNMDNRYAEPLVCTFPNLQKDSAYRFFPYRMESEPQEGYTKGRTFYGVSVKNADLDKMEVTEKVERAFVNPKRDEPTAPNHLPKLVFKEKQGSMKPTAVSVEAKEDFLDDLLTKALDRLGYQEDNNQSSNTQQTAAKETPAAKPTTNATKAPVEDDDLPF